MRTTFPLPRTSLPALACVIASATACPPVEPPPGEDRRRALLANVADEIVTPRLALLEERSAALAAATVRARDEGEGARAAAQQAWRDTMAVWEELEVIHLGPAGSPAAYTGGLGLRDRIDAWPLVNLCAIDQQLLDDEFEQAGWAAARLPNVLGLAALEYVMFVDVADNACPADSAMNVDGTWTALGAAEVADRRARYAAVVAAEVAAAVTTLREAWRGDDGFAQALGTAGTKGSPFSTAQLAIDELYAALFALELVTKDKKLGVPAGLHADCTDTTCPDQLESPRAKTSREHVLANLEGVRRVFIGLDAEDGDAVGFEDLLRDAKADDVADGMAASIEAAIGGIRAMDGSYEDSAPGLEPVVQSYELVKVFTDDFKSVFASTLGLRVPDEGAGDND